MGRAAWCYVTGPILRGRRAALAISKKKKQKQLSVGSTLGRDRVTDFCRSSESTLVQTRPCLSLLNRVHSTYWDRCELWMNTCYLWVKEGFRVSGLKYTKVPNDTSRILGLTIVATSNRESNEMRQKWNQFLMFYPEHISVWNRCKVRGVFKNKRRNIAKHFISRLPLINTVIFINVITLSH